MATDLSLDTLIKFVPKFDGNRKELYPFLNDCDAAIELCPETLKETLLKYIIHSIKGNARYLISNGQFETYSELRSFLIVTFGDNKHISQLEHELRSCRQRPNESIIDYIHRIETCTNNLIGNVRLSTTDSKEVTNGRIKQIEDNSLYTFIFGLRPELSSAVRLSKPTNLSEATNFALDEDKFLRASKEFNSHFHSNNNSQLFCNFCKRKGHSINNCRSKPSQFNNNNNKTSLVRNIDSDQKFKFCNYCKKKGHLIAECRIREYNNQKYKNQKRENQNSLNMKVSEITADSRKVASQMAESTQ